jgi:hypothetical protein
MSDKVIVAMVASPNVQDMTAPSRPSAVFPLWPPPAPCPLRPVP